MNDKFDNRNRAEGGGAQTHLTPDQLTAYLDSDLVSSERARADTHLRTCDDCRRALSEMRATVVLLRGLPEYRARRSFHLSPEQAGQGRSWWERWGVRLLPALPALRAATVAVAVLFVVVSAGEVIRDNSGDQASEVPAQTLPAGQVTPTGAAAVAPQSTTVPQPTPQETVEQAPQGNDEADSFRLAEPTSEPPSSDGDTFGGDAVGGNGAGNAEPAAVAPAPTEDEAVAEGAIAEESEDTAASEAGVADGETDGGESGVADQAQAGDTGGEAAVQAAAAATEPEGADADDGTSIMMSVPASESTPPAEAGRSAAADKAADEANAAQATPATPTPTAVPATPTTVPATPSPAPAASPTATATRTPFVDSRPTVSDDGSVSGWRVAQIGLAVVFAWLLVTVVGLHRLRGRRGNLFR